MKSLVTRSGYFFFGFTRFSFTGKAYSAFTERDSDF